MTDVSREDVKQMVIELTLGVSKEDSQLANASDRHSKRWDQVATEFERATSNVDTPAAFDPSRMGTESSSA